MIQPKGNHKRLPDCRREISRLESGKMKKIWDLDWMWLELGIDLWFDDPRYDM